MPGDASLLYPEEAVSVAKAVPKRVGEFAAGRLCARRALAEFGITGVPLTMAPDRAPVWPESMVGSITHTRGLCAAVVAERRRFASLGIDVEVAGDVETGSVAAYLCGRRIGVARVSAGVCPGVSGDAPFLGQGGILQMPVFHYAGAAEFLRPPRESGRTG